MVRTIAITGGIGSGKSQLCALLEKRGYVGCNADDLSREIFEIESVRKDITSVFGEKAFDKNGKFARDVIRGLVFSDPSLRAKLEAITHPAIATLYNRRVEALEKISPKAWFFYEAAVILEAKRHDDFDAIVLVTADEDVRLSRLKEFRNLDKDTARKIMASQMSDADKAKFAHFVIDNSHDLETLESYVSELVTFLENKFS